jgi:hypothetical protein
MAKGKQAGVRHWLVITPPPVVETPGKPVSGGTRPWRGRLCLRNLHAAAASCTCARAPFPRLRRPPPPRAPSPPSAQRPAHPARPTPARPKPPAPLAPKGARTMNNTRLYVAELDALAKKYGGTLLDIFTSWQRVPGWEKKFINDDKLHINGAQPRRRVRTTRVRVRACVRVRT